MAMFSTRHWKITNRRRARAPTTRHRVRATRRKQNCEEFSGTSGFSEVSTSSGSSATEDSGKVLRKEKFHTDYIAGDNVLCGAPPAPDPEPKPKAEAKAKAQAGTELTRGVQQQENSMGTRTRWIVVTGRVARRRPRTGSPAAQGQSPGALSPRAQSSGAESPPPTIPAAGANDWSCKPPRRTRTGRHRPRHLRRLQETAGPALLAHASSTGLLRLLASTTATAGVRLPIDRSAEQLRTFVTGCSPPPAPRRPPSSGTRRRHDAALLHEVPRRSREGRRPGRPRPRQPRHLQPAAALSGTGLPVPGLPAAEDRVRVPRATSMRTTRPPDR